MAWFLKEVVNDTAVTAVTAPVPCSLQHDTFPFGLGEVGRVVQPVYRLATGWTVRGSNPDGGEIFRTRSDRPWGPPSLLYNGDRIFPGGKAAGAW
jgi:hypothetical protein